MSSLTIFLKTQLFYFVLLILSFHLPLILFYQFSSFPIPHLQYFCLAFLVITQYVFFNETGYKDKKLEVAKRQLQAEKDKIPSHSEMNVRLNIFLTTRTVAIALTGVGIILIAIFYGQF